VSAAPGSMESPRVKDSHPHNLLLTVAVVCVLLDRGVELLFSTYCIVVVG